MQNFKALQVRNILTLQYKCSRQKIFVSQISWAVLKQNKLICDSAQLDQAEVELVLKFVVGGAGVYILAWFFIVFPVVNFHFFISFPVLR